MLFSAKKLPSHSATPHQMKLVNTTVVICEEHGDDVNIDILHASLRIVGAVRVSLAI